MKAFIFIGCILLLLSCSDKDDQPDQLTSRSWINTFDVHEGDTIKLIMGTFGDEEGVSIYENPKHAVVNEVHRDLSISVIYYFYSPESRYSGKDSVGLVVHTGSDGASPGVKDSVKIYFQVNP